MKGTQVFAIPSFSAFLIARFCLTFAFQVQAVTMSLEVYEITGDALSLGLAGLIEAIPFMMVILPAGFWADVYRRKHLILITSSLFICCSVILYLLSVDAFGEISQKLPLLYMVIGMTGLARGIAGPAIQATIPNLLPRDLLPQGVAWNTSFWQVASIAGPAVGGMLYGYFGKESSYLTSVISSSCALIAFSFLPNLKPSHIRNESMVNSLLTGVRFVRKQRLILSALTLDLFAVLFGGAVALLPVFNAEILKAGPDGLGILRSAPSIGAVITAFLLARNPPLKNSGRTLLLSVGAFGVCMIAFALSEYFWLSFFILLLSGLFDGVSVLIRSTIVQLYTPDEMRGRVSSVNSIFIGSSNEIGAFESGVAAKWLGLVPSVIFGGFMTIGITSLMATFAPKLRKLQLDDQFKKQVDVS
jgi:MFS family permease